MVIVIPDRYGANDATKVARRRGSRRPARPYWARSRLRCAATGEPGRSAISLACVIQLRVRSHALGMRFSKLRIRALDARLRHSKGAIRRAGSTFVASPSHFHESSSIMNLARASGAGRLRSPTWWCALGAARLAMRVPWLTTVTTGLPSARHPDYRRRNPRLLERPSTYPLPSSSTPVFAVRLGLVRAGLVARSSQWSIKAPSIQQMATVTGLTPSCVIQGVASPRHNRPTTRLPAR